MTLGELIGLGLGLIAIITAIGGYSRKSVYKEDLKEVKEDLKTLEVKHTEFVEKHTAEHNNTWKQSISDFGDLTKSIDNLKNDIDKRLVNIMSTIESRVNASIETQQSFTGAVNKMIDCFEKTNQKLDDNTVELNRIDKRLILLENETEKKRKVG